MSHPISHLPKDGRMYVAGSDTLGGAAILRALNSRRYDRIIDEPDGLNLRDADSTNSFFSTNRPEYVFVAAGKSGGIGANQKFPAELMLDNLLVTCNVIHAAYKYAVRKLIYVASSCCYPRDCAQPMRVEHLMTGPLEPTNESYASAKLAGLQLCRAYRKQCDADFIGVIPANIFGPGDDFSTDDSHVIGALIRKMHNAKIAGDAYVELWGTGKPQREFIFADDFGEACLFVMEHFSGPEPINVGAPSQRVSIRELALLIKETVGYEGEVRFDSSRPDGMPRKILDTDPLQRLGWSGGTAFARALCATYQFFLEIEHRREASHV